MKLVNITTLASDKIQPRYLQFLAHWVYILLSLQLYQSAAPFITFLVTYGLIALIMFMGKKHSKTDYFDHTYLSVFVVCNSTYLNVLYNYNYLFLFPIVAILAINMKMYFRRINKNKSMLNPSMSAIFILSLLFPQFYNYGPNLWSSEWWQILIIFTLGTYVTYVAKTLVVACSYVVTFIISSLLIAYLLNSFPIENFTVANPLSWILGLLSFGKVLYIFHVICDPASGPSTFRGKIIFGVSIAFIEVLLKYFNILNNIIISYILVLTILHLYESYQEKKEKKVILGPEFS